MEKVTLAGMRIEELENLMNELNASNFRPRQIQNWVYLKSVSNID